MSTSGAYAGDPFLAFQLEGNRHLGLSLTRACPLRCAHCAISTVAPGNKRGVTIPAAAAARLAADLPLLAEAGVGRLSFTGGEPTLALDHLRLLAGAAAAAGIETTVVTAAHWATSRRAAEHLVGDVLPAVNRWHLSTDAFHIAFVEIERIVHAARAVRSHGAELVIRLATSEATAETDDAIVSQLRASLPADVVISVQPVMPVGRAARLDLGRPQVAPLPCVSTGPLVRDDGSVSPCCASLADAPEGTHPFTFPNAFGDGGVVGAWRAWHDDPLLQLIRSVGFAPVLDWVRDGQPDHPVLARLPLHPCDVCVALWSRPGTAKLARTRAEGARVRIHELRDHVFGRPLPASTTGSTA